MTDTNKLQVYTIPAASMPGLLHRLGQLSKKSQRIMGKPISLNVINEVKQPRMVDGKQATDREGNLCWEVVFKATIDAENPKINGWTFVATIDHSASAGNMIRVSPNANCEVPEKYRTIQPICDHCNKIRSRRDTFLLRSDTTGELKQIGRQCIRDFIGYDVEQLVAMAEIVCGAVPNDSDADGDWTGGMADRRYIMVRTYLAHVSAMIRTHGWVSRKEASERGGGATSNDAQYNMFPPSGTKKAELIDLTDKDFEIAEGAIEWAAKLPGKSDYEYNLSVLAKETVVEHRSIGLLASMVPGFLRAMQREFEYAQRRTSMGLANSKYIGTPGDKIGVKRLHTIKPFEATLYGFHVFSGSYGPTYMYRFQAADGNVVVWYASESVAETLDLGGSDATNRVKVRINGGTVKKHQEYNGIKQTVLTRCKIEVLKEPEAA